MKQAIPKTVAIVIMGKYGDGVEFDDYEWYIEPYDITRIRCEDVFYVSNTFIISGKWIGRKNGNPY